MTLGRPRFNSDVRRVPISLAMNSTTIEAIDAVRKNYSRSEYIERVMNRALEEV